MAAPIKNRSSTMITTKGSGSFAPEVVDDKSLDLGTRIDLST